MKNVLTAKNSPTGKAEPAGKKRSNIRNRTRAAFLALVIAALAPMLVATPAQASDLGGNGSPTGCAGAYTVASKTIYGSRGITAGKPIGQLELRWSSSCYGNWARVVLYGGLYSSPVNVEQFVSAEGRTASANDTFRVPSGGTTAWTPYVRLQNSRSQACVTAHVSSDFGTLNYHTNGASFCI
jgi:hypothetical protein